MRGVGTGAAQVFYDQLRLENRLEVAQDPYAIWDNAVLDELPKAIEEVACFKQWGGQTMIDCTLNEIGRDPLAMRDISARTGVNIILGCGHYYQLAHPEYLHSASVQVLADEMIKVEGCTF